MTKVVSIGTARKKDHGASFIEAIIKSLLEDTQPPQNHSGVEMSRYVGVRNFSEDSLVRELTIDENVELDDAIHGTINELTETFDVKLPSVPLIVFTSLILSVVRTHRAVNSDDKKSVNVALIKEPDGLLWLGLLYVHNGEEIGLLFKFDLTNSDSF